MQPGQLLDHVAPNLGIEGRQRLVEQEHAGANGQCAGDSHALLLAAGKLGGIAARIFRHADDGETVVDTRGDQLS